MALFGFILFIFTWVCVCACICVWCPQSPEQAADALKLLSQVAVSAGGGQWSPLRLSGGEQQALLTAGPSSQFLSLILVIIVSLPDEAVEDIVNYSQDFNERLEVHE